MIASGISTRWQSLLHQSQRLMLHFPLSLAGLLIMVLAVLALQGFGYQRMDLVVFALTICALSILAASVVMVTVSGLVLRRRINTLLQTAFPPLQAEAAYPNDTGLKLPAYSWLPLMTLEWRVVAPDVMQTRVAFNTDENCLEETVVPPLRCLGNELTRIFTVRDVLGLCRFSWRTSQPGTILVLPKTGNLRSLPVLKSMDAEDGIPNPRGNPDGDRMDIRRYAPGDSVRNIMWRVYARNRHLNVRLPEKSMFQAERTLAYLVAGDDDEAAAGVARFAVTQGALGSPWIFGADGSDQIARSAIAALPLIAGSRRPGKQPDYGLDDFLAHNGGQHSACIIFAPARSGAWVTSLYASMNRFPGPFTVVLATDDMNQSEPSPWWQRMLWQDQERKQGTQLSELRSLTGNLVRAGAQVLVVDRQSGQCFDQRLKRV